jgi:hypothetical protein
MADGFEQRKNLTFAQAEGRDPIPSQLKLREISQELRALLWNEMYRIIVSWSIDGELVQFGARLFRDMHIRHEHKMVDEFSLSTDFILRKYKALFASGDYIDIFDLLQWIFQREYLTEDFARSIDAVLETSRSAYRVFDGTTIVPIGSLDEVKVLERAFTDLANSEFHGARAHLLKAGSELTAGRISDSIRESIHAVESVARLLEPTGDFSKALAKLEKSTKIHGAMKAGFSALYGYTSDENGIRHPLLDENAAKVDETDALFMIGACASFVSYLINKARTST